MKNLSFLIREAAAPARWRHEVDLVAKSLGKWEQADVEVAWYAVSTVLESIAVLAVEYRHQDGEFSVALSEWLKRERARIHERSALISDESEPAFDRIVLTVLGEIVEKLGEVSRSYEPMALSRDFLTDLNPPALSRENRLVADEIAEHLMKAASKLRTLQNSTRNSNLEWEVYLNLIEGASRHFVEMGSVEQNLDVAA